MSFKRVVYSDSPGMEGIRWIIGICAFLVAFSVGGYLMYAALAPRYRAVDNAVFHQSQPYTDGMSERLDSLHVSYEEAGGPAARASIREIVRHEFSSPASRTHLTDEQQAFLAQMEQE